MRHGVATHRGWWGQSVVLVMVLATGALGFCCAFDGDDHDGQGSSTDLCLTLLSLSSAPPLFAGLLLQGGRLTPPHYPFAARGSRSSRLLPEVCSSRLTR